MKRANIIMTDKKYIYRLLIDLIVIAVWVLGTLCVLLVSATW